jgi:hypothetical protein
MFGSFGALFVCVVEITPHAAEKKSLAKLWSDALVTSGIKSVYRYTYGT